VVTRAPVDRGDVAADPFARAASGPRMTWNVPWSGVLDLASDHAADRSGTEGSPSDLRRPGRVEEERSPGQGLVHRRVEGHRRDSRDRRDPHRWQPGAARVRTRQQRGVAVGAVVQWRLYAEQGAPGRAEAVEHRAVRLIGVAFFVLAALVAITEWPIESGTGGRHCGPARSTAAQRFSRSSRAIATPAAWLRPPDFGRDQAPLFAR
jgi:hypothetical protein